MSINKQNTSFNSHLDSDLKTPINASVNSPDIPLKTSLNAPLNASLNASSNTALNKPLNEQIALITGASRGIGRAIALELAKQGATVIGTATSAEGAAQIDAYFAEAGLAGRGMVLNVTDAAQCEKALAEITSEFGALSILVNNAGITRDQLSIRMKEEDWDAVLETNLKAVFRMSRLALKSMLKARYGRIINITSVVSVTGNPGQANYVAAKAGVAGLSRALALEVSGRDITINCVAPGFIETDMTTALSSEQQAAIQSKIPMGRMGRPHEIAHAVGFLASKEASYITGTTLHVNGGMFMG